MYISFKAFGTGYDRDLGSIVCPMNSFLCSIDHKPGFAWEDLGEFSSETFEDHGFGIDSESGFVVMTYADMLTRGLVKLSDWIGLDTSEVLFCQAVHYTNKVQYRVIWLHTHFE
jgi:hypothetical protein